MKRNPTLNQSQLIVFVVIGYSVSKEVKAPNTEHVEKLKNSTPSSNMIELEFLSAYQIFMDE